MGYSAESVRKHLAELDDDEEPALDNVIKFPDERLDDLEEDEEGFVGRGRFILRRDPRKPGKVLIIGEINEDELLHSQELWIGDIALVADSRYYSHKKLRREPLSAMVEKGGLNKKTWRRQMNLDG